MHLAEGWKDYQLLDAGGGEKFESWAGIKVVRPDPQAFWPRNKSINWNEHDMYYHRSKSGGGSWEIKNPKTPEAWKVAFSDLKFHIRPTGFKHMGLFPEQAVNWQWVQNKIKAAQRPINVLNLFAYTGGATVSALSAGASVTHVDAAKGMNNWAKDNIHLSGLSAKPHRILTDDVLKFVRREGRRGTQYDGIIMDPPVFGRGPGGEMWKLEEKLYELVNECAKILSDQPLFILINAYTAGFSPTVFGNVLDIIKENYRLGGIVSTAEIGLPAKSNVILPCGMFARWESI